MRGSPLAGLARETATIRLGTLVTAATFRMPGPLANAVAGVDQMSGGRGELGLGAGWFDAEHAGGKGKTRTRALAARYASEFNMPFTDLDTFRAQCRNVATACESTGRDPGRTPGERRRRHTRRGDRHDHLDLVAETVAPHLA